MASDRKLNPKLTRAKLSGVVSDPKSALKNFNGQTANDILLEAQRAWDGLYNARKERIRNRKYMFGDQWSDQIQDPDNINATIREDEYIRRQGKVPLKQNLILRLVKSVMGQYRTNQTKPICVARDRKEQQLGEVMTAVLEYNHQINRMHVLDARGMMEFLLSGSIFMKDSYAWRNDRKDIWTDMVNFNRVFFDNKMEDPRHFDCRFIGEIHDITFAELLGRFATNKNDIEVLKDIYARANDSSNIWDYAQNLSARRIDNISFFVATEPGMCRVIEIWRKESKQRYRCHDVLNGEYFKIEKNEAADVDVENMRRIEEGLAMGMMQQDIPLIEKEWFVDDYWQYYYLSPFGHVLKTGETPYSHKSHPYSFTLYPFVDGEIHSFVGDVIDQQRYLNRLITLADFIMSSSAKGVLMVPEPALGKYTPEQFAEQWVKFNGVIVYKPTPGVDMPKQVTANSTNIGIFEIVNLQLKFMEDISGVHGSMQGAAPSSGTAASLYAQQTANAVTNLVDVMDSFKAFREDRDTKKVKMITQFYTDKIMLNNISTGASKIGIYDPDKVSDVEFDLSVQESTSTPLFRMMQNEMLMQLFQAGAISVEILLENGNFPNADGILQSIKSAKEQMQEQQSQMQQQAQQQVPPEQQAAMQQQLQAAQQAQQVPTEMQPQQ